MNTLMIAKWRVLGHFQARYVPAMIGPFLEVSLIPHTGTIPSPPSLSLIVLLVCMQQSEEPQFPSSTT